MIKQNTSISRRTQDIIGGEWICAENNTHGTAINFVPELFFAENNTYRGHFHVIDNGNGTISVYNTTEYQFDNENTPDDSGVVFLHWQEITEVDEEGTHCAFFRKKLFVIPVLEHQRITQSGWLVLKIRRLADGVSSNYTFSDKYLGEIAVEFSWYLMKSLTLPPENCDYLFIAYINYDSKNSAMEIVQQQYGPALMRLPMTSQGESSSSAESSSSTSSSSSSSTSDSQNSNSSTSGEDSDSGSSNSSSSSISDASIIYVNFYYLAKTTTLNGSELTYAYTEMQLNGSFAPGETYPANGYQLTMTGWEKYTLDITNEPFVNEQKHSMRIFRNTDSGFWDFFDAQTYDWGAYYDYYDSANDVLSKTTLYEHPDLENNPVYPRGQILVNHEITRGTTSATPSYFMTSKLIVTFSTTPPETDEEQA